MPDADVIQLFPQSLVPRTCLNCRHYAMTNMAEGWCVAWGDPVQTEEEALDCGAYEPIED